MQAVANSGKNQFGIKFKINIILYSIGRYSFRLLSCIQDRKEKVDEYHPILKHAERAI